MRIHSFIALALTAAVPAGCGEGVTTLRLIEHAETDQVTDLPPAGDSVGDVLTFANKVFDETNQRQAGTNSGYSWRTCAGR